MQIFHWAASWNPTTILAQFIIVTFLSWAVDFSWAVKIGGTIRAGDGEPVSGELFTGAAIRYKGIAIGPLVVAPRMTVGFSLVTHTIGVETQRADTAGSDGTLLVYLGPELSFSMKQNPKTEFFYRTHHRSGLLKTFENMSAGHNSHVFGIRKKF